MSIELTQEQVKELFDYDADNGWLIRRFKSGKTKPCGYKSNRSDGYGSVRIGEKVYYTHRIIWLWHYGEFPEFIDHIDRNRINNRLDNLRDATGSENSHNIGLSSRNTSGSFGAHYRKTRKKYQASIGVNNKRIYLGLFNTLEEAFLAYQLAKIEYHPSSPIAQEYLRELTLAG